ncbi:MAG TPA: hypothetical protein IAC04_00790 [Candidatus Coprenecus stercoravium]|uniref:Tetratricopeptide repeat protein n=1 Tax=Candidatus Coprenecus stercoravium TaxID=2840735 RepID=A0A9D2GQB7_9BACT|nr:hypothetical protein [Candidatus Coprenecus stercoravium]
MKKIFNVLMFAAAAMLVQSCGSPKKMAESAEDLSVSCNPQVLEVVAGNIKADVTVTFPEDFFHPKAIVEVVPVLVYEGGETALDPVMLQGEDVTENYQVVPEAGGSISRTFEFAYTEGVEDSYLELRMTVIHKDKRIPFTAPYKVADGANTTYMLVKTGGSLAYAPDAYQAIINEQNEAQILYLINSATVRPSQLKSDEIKAFQEFLTNLKADERRELVSTDIIAYASPDGKEDFNAKLSERRAKTASDAFSKKINNKNVGIETTVNTSNVDEDWDGFQALVSNSSIEDKDLILRVLEMYSDPAVREREIKNMSEVYTTLKKDILPELRRARFIANIEFTNYSNDELIALVNDNIEILDEEALLRAASLLEDADQKVTVYQKAIEKFNSDRARINLGVAYLALGKNADAENALASVSDKNNAYYNNAAGVVALRKGDNEAAAAAFNKSSLKEAQYNLAVIDILNGNYADAAAKLNGAGCSNEALVNILNGNLDAAAAIIADCNCAYSSYLKAIIAARQGDVEAANAALENVAKDEALAARAENDIEFAKIR